MFFLVLFCFLSPFKDKYEVNSSTNGREKSTDNGSGTGMTDVREPPLRKQGLSESDRI